MNPQAIRRLPNGAIDIDFYRRQSEALRKQAMRLWMRRNVSRLTRNVFVNALFDRTKRRPDESAPALHALANAPPTIANSYGR